ncbi:MAG TPA: cytochrome ubiquinol oxidase subunit I [Rudaea sp.]|nr:cytochrome ubiquinol oxidase subunit I [Rudaea sp.]
MSDAEFLSRLQFGFVISFHILFPAFTIGIAWWLAFLEALWLRRREDHIRDLYFFWLRIFAVSFGMGVVSGIVMSFQFGTNWSQFSIAAGNVIGPLLDYEVLTAFFLEATFLGVMLFGWRRVSHRTHFLATCAVALGTLISTFWIISANSWMQTPAGYELRDGVFYPVDWAAVIFNPSFLYRLPHMVLGAFLTTATVVAGIAGTYLLRDFHVEKAKLMLRCALGFIAITAPLQIFVGDMHGLEVREYQPAKLAAIEARWETERGVPLTLFAIPDESAETNRYALDVPRVGSVILTHAWDGEVKGLKDFPPDARPPVKPVFFAFRLMVGIGFAMLVQALAGLVLWWRGRVFSSRWYLRLCACMTPAGFLAVLCGWYTAEIGRQPWVVYGQMRTADAFSGVALGSVATSLVAFVCVYAIVFGFGIWYLVKLLRAGPVAAPPRGGTEQTPARPLSAADGRSERPGASP